MNRRKFINQSVLGTTALAVASTSTMVGWASTPITNKDSYDPWIEIERTAIKHNVKELYRLSGNKPLMAVVKNNGYGLDCVEVSKILQTFPEVVGFAAVKPEECIRLRSAGIRKPILHLGIVADTDGVELLSKDVQLSIISCATPSQLERLSKKANKKVKGHFYLDTGMSRMGIPYYKSLPTIKQVNKSNYIDIVGSLSGFTEDAEYDFEQLRRMKGVHSEAQKAGLNMGKLHMASSTAVFNFPESNLDMVRPGLSLYGAYPSDYSKEKKIGWLKLAFRLQARVARVQQIRTGDSVSYGRSYIASKPTWIATLPIGHADGYIRNAVKGAKVLIKGHLYPVIGFVSASHTIIELGDHQTVNVGDVATLYGPDHEEVHPNYISNETSTSVYDILMHLSARIPKIII